MRETHLPASGSCSALGDHDRSVTVARRRATHSVEPAIARTKLKLLTEEEAAEHLRITPAQLARIRRTGGIGHIRVAQRSYRYTEAILEEYLRLHTVEPRLWLQLKERERRAREAAGRREGRQARHAVSSKDNAANRDTDTFGSGIFRKPKNF